MVLVRSADVLGRIQRQKQAAEQVMKERLAELLGGQPLLREVV